MSKVAIIYFSGSGNTAKMAEAVSKGVSSVQGSEASLISINGDDIVKGRYKNEEVMKQIEQSDAVIFGSPTYMAGISAQFKAFADATVDSWVQQKWSDKLAAGFTVSGTPSGDKLAVLQYIQAFAMQHGMIWAGTGELPSQPNGVNRLGSWIGVMAESTQDPATPISTEDLFAAEVIW